MRILQHQDTRYTADGGAPLSDHDVLERLEVPDDLSGLAEIPSIGEPGAEAVTEPRRSATTVRWLRWLSVIALATAGIVIAAISMAGDEGTSDPVPTVDTPSDWQTDGPGSNSMTAPWLIQSAVPWATVNDGPGGHSLNAVADSATTAVAPSEIEFSWATHGPGSNSIASMATPATVWSWETNGPGSNSMTAPWLTTTQVPWASTNDGPGGHSLNMVET